MKRKLAVYVHIPFCVRKCAYCDFLSAPAPEEVRQEYMRALAGEISFVCGKNLWDGYEVHSVFFGGGTPSILEEWTLCGILELLRKRLFFGADAEITVECNPGTLTKDKLSAYKRAGLNRVSIGLQSARNRELEMLGRIHTWEDFLMSFRLVREAGFDNVNVDLMSALPGQTAASWEETLEKVVSLKPEHISAYSLIIEEGTPFYERYGGEACFGGVNENGNIWEERQAGEAELSVLERLPDEDTEREMYARTGEVLFSAGYRRYEISNYALPGKECRHNISYWDRTEYIGFGLGAASFLGDCRFSNERELARYLERAGREDVRGEICKLSEKDGMEEFMFLGLRMMRGVSQEEFFCRFGKRMDEVYGDVLKKHISLGLLKARDGHVFLTERGIDVSNAVFCDFLLDG